jgi:hypothetical protein
MAQTITTKGPLNTVRMATGRYLDTGSVAAYTFTLGFKPRYVKVVNLAASSSSFEWFEGMADASAWKTATNGDGAIVTTNGITVSESGFILGLDTDVNVASEQISFVALG